MKTIKLHLQPTGNTCGPACLYMVKEYIKSEALSDMPYPFGDKLVASSVMTDSNLILYYAKLCGTDWVVGTPPDRMEKGMKALKIQYVEYMGSPRPFELLRQAVENKNIAILRTITHGVPHWILVKGYTNHISTDGCVIGFFYEVLDPATGYRLSTEADLDEIWKPRNYQFFEIQL